MVTVSLGGLSLAPVEPSDEEAIRQWYELRCAVVRADPRALGPLRSSLIRRGLFLLALCFVNLTIWAEDILRVYGVSILVAVWFLGATGRRLWAVGLTFVILCAEIDLSVGSVAGLASVVTAMAVANWGVVAGVLAGLAVGVVVGSINGALVAGLNIPSFLVTLGMLGIAVGMATNMPPHHLGEITDAIVEMIDNPSKLPAATAIRSIYEQEGELSAAIEVRRRFPGIVDNEKARQCARTIAGWTPRPIPAVLRTTSPNYPVGHSSTFYILGEDTNRYFQAPATIRYKTPHLYMYVQNGLSVDSAALRKAADLFEHSTYPTDRSYFGSEWRPGVDGDPHIVCLIADLRSASAGGPSGERREGGSNVSSCGGRSAAARPSACRDRRKPRFGSCSHGMGPVPCQPDRRSWSRPR